MPGGGTHANPHAGGQLDRISGHLTQIGGLDPLPHEIGRRHRQERGGVIHAVHVRSGQVDGHGGPVKAPRGDFGGVPHVVRVTVCEQDSTDVHPFGLKNFADQMLDACGRVNNKGCARPGRDEHKPIRRVKRRRDNVKTHVTPWTRRSARAKHAWFRGSHARRKPPCCHP